ncbi:HNH endonuclease [Ornithinimicrobium sp. EGI L100131]|nr:HNH endonuclease [Ornithinimicrobium sediminis]
MGRDAPRMGGEELVSALAQVDVLRARTETVTVRLVAEALGRGVHTDQGLSAQDWVAQRCPWLSGPQVADVVAVARGVGDPVHGQVADAVWDSLLPVRRAAAVLRAAARVRPFLDTDQYVDAVGTLLGVAVEPRHSDPDLRRVADHLVSVVVPDRDHDTRARAAAALRGVHESSLADGSLTRFVLTCDADGAALLRSVLASPLAAPVPDETGGPDPRTASQRRYDAVLTVLRRGLAGGDSTPTSPKATVVVTIAWDPLQEALTGTGTTATGDVLSPGTVRRVACDAQLIPQVLGTDREVLDQGRARRLVTPGQRVVLAHRDQGCTFPGCTVPQAWCEAHHVVHWSRGGRSDIDNYALLCGRHHTLVHDHDLTATVTTTSVTWHL